MNQGTVIEIGRQAVNTVLMMSLPMLALALLVGLAISIFQATTQIQEQTLVFIPKIIAVMLALVIFGPWILSIGLDFTQRLFSNLNNFVQ